MPGLQRDLKTLFIEAFLDYCPEMRNTDSTKEMLLEWSTLYFINFFYYIEMYLAELEWNDFNTLSQSILQFYIDDNSMFICDVKISRMEQIVKVKLTSDAFSILSENRLCYNEN